MTITIVYGSESGATKSVATRIAKKMGGRTLDIREATARDFEESSFLILGAPTYGAGDLPSDWEDNFDALKSANIEGKTVALFGLGDQETYPDSFLDAMGLLYDQVIAQGATVIGFTETDGFTYTSSMAEQDGQFVGLAIDEDTQSDQTSKRITAWVERLA